MSKDRAALEFEGLEVVVFRGPDGTLSVGVYSDDIDEDDTFGDPGQVPRLRIIVNDDAIETRADGGWSSEWIQSDE
jgi:hypothetical protein